ncbi:calcium-binding protein [Pseudonocardiaceae bacterium YIM PH 21723]|nr:calcium-binding protein [Pseudonocardiaceae bacterium YIM PH 21723]
MTVSAFLDKKLNRRFRTYDLNGDGFVDKSDFDEVAHRVNEAFGLDATEPRAQMFRERLLEVWRTLAELADGDQDGRISLDEYKSAFADRILADREAFLANYRPLVDAIMDIADTGGDGRIGLEEHIRWYTSTMGISPAEATESFRRLDRDGNGFITRDEAAQAVVEYYFSDDPQAPGNWILGKID